MDETTKFLSNTCHESLFITNNFFDNFLHLGVQLVLEMRIFDYLFLLL
jgi:hypothetical protein